MPIQFNYPLKVVNGTNRIDTSNLAAGKSWMAWWYCGVKKNKKSKSYVLVAFRELINGKPSDKPVLQTVLIELLGQVRIGSVWKDGLCTHQAIFETNDFDVDFTYKTWKTNSFLQTIQNKESPPYPSSIYPLDYPNDKNWLLEFPLPQGGKLVIPCIEFFTRCYGRSGELKRLLATYPWYGQHEADLSRFYAPLDEDEIDDGSIWKVKLKQRFLNGDVIFLAHAKYDKEYCEKVVKEIHAQIEDQHDPRNPSSLKPLKVAPWFQGDARMRVRGIWFNNNKSFLVLNIIGCSDPDGINILRDRAISNKVNQQAEIIDGEISWNGAPKRIISPQEIIDITGDLEPDHNAPIIEIHDPDFVTLGKPRVVYDKWRDIRRDKAKDSSGFGKQATDVTAFATGDPYGSNKGVGYASISANTVMESHGVLRDVWDAMLYLKKMHPTRISSVDWFTFVDGYKASENPKLIPLIPFAKEIIFEKNTDIKYWLYINTKTLQPRQILVARMIVDDKSVYILEIQRRPRKIDPNSEKKQIVEEPYTGFVFLGKNESIIEETIEYFLDRVRSVKGIVKNLLNNCPCNAYSFQHKPARDEQVACQAAVLKALEKVGITI